MNADVMELLFSCVGRQWRRLYGQSFTRTADSGLTKPVTSAVMQNNPFLSLTTPPPPIPNLMAGTDDRALARGRHKGLISTQRGNSVGLDVFCRALRRIS